MGLRGAECFMYNSGARISRVRLQLALHGRRSSRTALRRRLLSYCLSCQSVPGRDLGKKSPKKQKGPTANAPRAKSE